jgi:septal ring factor EnvC (AmiA/AmiB activator)
MMPRLRLVLLAVVLCVVGSAGAQGTRETQRKLDRIKHELHEVARQRRKLEGQRSAASTQLRAVDEQLGQSGRALNDTEASLAQEQASLADLRRRRDALQLRLGHSREQLAQLLRAAYTVGRAAPLKLLLSQDTVADADRVLAYHRYLQRDRAQRIGELTAALQALDVLEQRIVSQRSELDATRQQQRRQLLQLQQDRKAHAQAVAQLDQRYQDKREREQALGSDARSLEQLLAQLRAAAARETQRRAAEAREAAQAARASGHHAQPRPPAPVIANAQPIRVGGLGWPLSGTLLAGYGARLPDGGTSSGLLIAAPAGTAVKAVANGKVVFGDWMNGYGLILIVDHGNGTMSLYAHNEALLRDTGDDVRRGDPVASVGSSGSSGAPALYFELRRNGKAVDPRSWLQQQH